MVITLLLTCAVSTYTGDAPMVEVARTVSGEMMVLTNPDQPYRRFRVAILPSPGHGDEVLFHYDWTTDSEGDRSSPDVLRLGGPVPWGVTPDGGTYVVTHRWTNRLLNGAATSDAELLRGASIDGHIVATAWMIDDARGRRDADHARAWSDFRTAHGSHCTPLMEIIRDDYAELYNKWDIFFDYIYTSLDTALVVMVRDGVLRAWELDEAGIPNRPWSAHSHAQTATSGPFRILRAGPDLEHMYLVDETGTIYTGFGSDHRRLGVVVEYDRGPDGSVTVVLEDQMASRIAFAHITESGEITPLAIDWEDDEFAADFMIEIEDQDVRRGLQRLAEIVRTDAQNGGGD